MLQHLLDPDPPSATDAHRDAVRRRAAELTRNRRTALVTGLCVVAAASIVAVVALSDGATTTRTIDRADTTTTTEIQPLLPDDASLFEGPIPTVPLMPVLVDDPITLSFEASPERGVGVRFEHADGIGWAGMSAEPQHLRPIMSGGVREHESRGDWAFQYGVTRADIVRITLVPAEGAPITVGTVAHPAAPGVRFFVVEDPGLPNPEATDARHPLSVLYGYDEDGRLLSDTAR